MGRLGLSTSIWRGASALRKYLSVVRIDTRQLLVYRGEFLMRGVSMALFMVIFCALWSTVYATGGGQWMAGLRLPQVVWYVAMTETIVLSRSRLYIEISESVKSGDVAYVLTRPYSYVGFQVAHEMGAKLPLLLLNIAVASLVVLPFAGGVETTLAGAAGFVVLALVGGLLDAMVCVLIGLGAFYMEDVVPLAWIYGKLLLSVGGTLLPLDLFPEWLRRISDVLPFQYIVYAPARTFVAYDSGFFCRALAGQVVYCAALAIALWALWRQGCKRLVVHGG